MRSARPMKLKSGRWGAWVPGEDVKPDMLICVRTRNRNSWYSKVERVFWQGVSGAICKRIDIPEEDDMNVGIPFLDHFSPVHELDKSRLEWLRNWVYYRVEDANGPAPVIDNYEYCEDYEIDCDVYESRAQDIIKELEKTLFSMHLQTTQNGPSGANSSEGGYSFVEGSVVGEAQKNVLTPVQTAMNKSETHCLQCDHHRNECVCRSDISRNTFVIDKYGIVSRKENSNWCH